MPDAVQKTIRLQRLAAHLIERRDGIVPFQQGGGVADQPDGVGVELPYGIQDGVIMRIEDVFFEFRMASDMDLRHVMMRDIIQIVIGIELMIFR